MFFDDFVIEKDSSSTIFETEKYYWIVYKQKCFFESRKPVFFQAFLSLDETFYLKLTGIVCHGIPFR